MSLVALALLVVSLVLFVQALFSLYLMLYTWEHPERLEASSGPRSFLPPRLSFSVLLPARHEEAVIFQTVKRVWAANYPSDLLEIVVVCHADDTDTIVEARRAIREIGSPRVRVETFSEEPINKPHGLNVGLERTTNEVVTIFDAEDDVDPDVFNVINTVMQEEGTGIVQSGVQLMNFRDHWFSVHNCLEYFFYFKSRLHFHAKVGMIPLGGNTVFIRRELLDRIGGWDQNCLTEDADIGIRLSVLGEPIRVVYSAQHVTREETPDSVTSFVKQRTRWHQGFLQILRKGSWLSLPKYGQKLLAFYTLSYSVFQGLVTLLWPLAIVAIFLIEVPTLVAMMTFLPLYALLLQLLINVIGTFAFAREYGLKCPLLMPVSMTVSFLPFQFLLGFSAVRAIYRELRSQNNWEKTQHLGAHRRSEVAFPTEYELVLDEALNHLDATCGSVMVLDSDQRTFSVVASRGLPAEIAGSGEVSAGGEVSEWVARRELPAIINEREAPDELRSAWLNQFGFRSSIVVPIEQSDGTSGALSLSSKGSMLKHEDLRWLSDRVSVMSGASAKPTDSSDWPAREKVLASQAAASKPANGRLRPSSAERYPANARRSKTRPSPPSIDLPSGSRMSRRRRRTSRRRRASRRQLVVLVMAMLLFGSGATAWLGLKKDESNAPLVLVTVEERIMEEWANLKILLEDRGKPLESGSESVRRGETRSQQARPTSSKPAAGEAELQQKQAEKPVRSFDLVAYKHTTQTPETIEESGE